MMKTTDQTLADRINGLLGNTPAKEFCLNADISESTFSTWRTGEKEPSAYNLVKLADAFHVTPNYLLGYEDKNTKVEIRKRLTRQTGLDEKSINALRKHNTDYLKMCVINYLLTDENCLDVLVRYFISDKFTDFRSNPKNKCLPMKTTYSVPKHQVAEFVEQMGRSKENFLNHVSKNTKIVNRINQAFWENEIDRQKCFNILGFRKYSDKLTYRSYKYYVEIAQYAYANGIFKTMEVQGDVAYLDDYGRKHYHNLENESLFYQAVVKYLQVHDGDTARDSCPRLEYVLKQMNTSREQGQSSDLHEILISIKNFLTLGDWIIWNIENSTDDINYNEKTDSK